MRLSTLMLSLAALVAASSVSNAAVRVDGSPISSSSIDGRWSASITRAALLRTGEVPPAEVGELYGPWSAQLANGRFRLRNQRTGRGGQGTFTISGYVVRFVFTSGVAVRPGAVAVCRESVYRDRLTFTRVAARPCLAWDAAVWVRG